MSAPSAAASDGSRRGPRPAAPAGGRPARGRAARGRGPAPAFVRAGMRRGGEAAPARRSRWIPWTIAGAFAAIVLADLVMVAIAVRSDPGLVAGSPARLGTGNVLPPATGLRLDVRTA